MSEVRLTTSGPPETVLPPEPAALLEAIAAAQALPDAERRDALASVVARAPRSSSAWAALAAEGRDPIEQYAAYRVGYHRGLDSLRANGWRGSGYLRWVHESNRGVLRSFAGLMRSAQAIGEADEVERMATFLRQLDPSWSDDNV